MWNEISSVITDIGHCSKFSTLLLLPFEVFFWVVLQFFFFSFLVSSRRRGTLHCAKRAGRGVVHFYFIPFFVGWVP